MQKNKSDWKFSLLILSISLLSFIIAGCGKKSEEEQKQTTPTEKQEVTQQKTEQPPQTSGDSAPAEEKKEETPTTPKIASILGTWKGTLDSRSTTLTITEQNGTEFKGKITINYRNVINQEVEGFFRPENGEMFMKDLLHSRYKGNYRALFNEGFNKMNGSFTTEVDRKTVTFTLTKTN